MGNDVNLAAGASGRKLPVIIAIGTVQAISSASTYYLPAILADPIADDLSVSSTTIFGLFTIANLILAVCVPLAGKLIDRYGGRSVLCLSNVIIIAGLVLLANAEGLVSLSVAWCVLGIGMGFGLYDSAFAALARSYGKDARGAITGITLIAGFSGTIGWTVSPVLEQEFGWRECCLIWAAVHLFIAVPLHWFSLPQASRSVDTPTEKPVEKATNNTTRWVMIVLAFVFATNWILSAAMAAHLPRILKEFGASDLDVIAAAALFGPAQVAARFMEFSLMRRLHPLFSARLAAALHPIGAACLFLLGNSLAPLFVVCHAAGNGLMTIVRGTLPLILLGPVSYGLRTGLVVLPGRLAQALAPFVFALIIDELAGGVLLLSGGIGLASLAALFLIRKHAC